MLRGPPGWRVYGSSGFRAEDAWCKVVVIITRRKRHLRGRNGRRYSAMSTIPAGCTSRDSAHIPVASGVGRARGSGRVRPQAPPWNSKKESARKFRNARVNGHFPGANKYVKELLRQDA